MAPTDAPRASTRPSDTPHLAIIDAMRGVFALGVCCYHAIAIGLGGALLPWHGAWRSWPETKGYLALLPFSYGWAGVAGFFVISGFCIHLAHLKTPDWRTFAVRRFFRIYPAYLVVLLLCALVPALTYVPFVDVGPPYKQLVTHLLGVHSLWSGTISGINGSFWSIAVEMQLYAIYPLLLLAVRRWGWRTALLICALPEAARAILCAAEALELGSAGAGFPYATPAWFTGSAFAYWFSWSIGAYLADAYAKRKPLPCRRWPLVPLAIAAVAADAWIGTQPFAFTLFAVVVAVAGARWLAGDYTGRLDGPVGRALARTGTVSYSVYLVHEPLLRVFARALQGVGSSAARLALLYGSLAIVVTAAWGLYRLVERPGIELGRRLLTRRGATVGRASG